MALVRTVCPLNCPDCCSFLVKVEKTKVKVYEDKQTMGMNGFVCSKGRALGDLVFSPDRLLHPLLKTKGNFHKISWDQAYELISAKIKETLERSSSQAILHLFDHGHNGRLRELDNRFFQALGGVTEPRGDMCWGAGYQAQKKDFGAVYSSDWEDILHSKVIILWGRDPAVTNKHFIPYLLQAKEKGAYVLVINPLKVRSTAFADEYLQVNPGTDGVLALGIAHIILSKRWMDLQFVQDYTANFASYAALVKEYPPERVSAITGVPLEKLTKLAKMMTHERPVMSYLGYGLQRYINGGNTVRAIDALAAVSGNVGFTGAGVFYAHSYHKNRFNSVHLPEGTYHTRTYPHASLAAELLGTENIPIELALVTRSNPLITEPDSIRFRELWNSIPFKVTFDLRMSETAALSDLVLPVTTIFEEEDLLATSWSNRIHYAQPALEPQGESQPEPLIFKELAARLGLSRYFPYSPKEWIEYILEPLKEKGVTLEELSKGSVRAPYIPRIAWETKEFTTDSKKVELITKDEFFSTCDSPVSMYFHSRENLSDNGNENEKDKDKDKDKEYPYILMTPHPDRGLHTQFQEDQGFKAYLHPQTATKHAILQGDRVIVESELGELVATANISEDIHQQTIVIPEGTTDNYLGVNRLIPGRFSVMGESTAYYDVFCQIRRWEID